MGLTYRRPHVDAPVANLVPESSDGTDLNEHSIVLCINRGRHTIVDKFDGRDYPIPPGYIEMSYAAALHFQGRAVIPGTRNPEDGSQQSFIGILSDGWTIDTEDACQPLSDDELTRMGLSIEAIDREALSDSASQQVHAIKLGGRPPTRGPLTGKKPHIDASQQASEGAAEAAKHWKDKPGRTDAHRDAEAFEAEPDEAPPEKRRR